MTIDFTTNELDILLEGLDDWIFNAEKTYGNDLNSNSNSDIKVAYILRDKLEKCNTYVNKP